MVFLAYRVRRVDCSRCGVTAEMVPWCSVCRAVGHAVQWGLAHRDLSELTAVGIAEVAWGRGPTYLTLVYDLGGEARRLLAVAQERTEASRRSGLEGLGEAAGQGVRDVCSDLGKPDLNLIAERLSQAVHVLDRFHLRPQLGKAVDEIRAAEAKRLARDGSEPVLKRSRWCLLKRPENLTEKQTEQRSELLKSNLGTVRASLLRAAFQRLWEYQRAVGAGRFLAEWTGRVMRSGLEPMTKVARSLRAHRPLLLNWFGAQGVVSAGAVEGLHTKGKLVTRKSYGFRTAEVVESGCGAVV